MRARRYKLFTFGLWFVLFLGPASTAGAQCAAPACDGTADCSVDAGSGVDAPGCCTTTGCKTIQFAVNEASIGDVIKVAAGTYPENLLSALNITKTVTLCGERAGEDARTRIGSETRITNPRGTIVSASNVVIDGFTFEGVTDSIFPYGVDMAQGTEGTQVFNNIFQNNIAGIGLANKGPSQVLICQNLLQNNNQPGSASGTGIYSDQYVCGTSFPCTNFVITENTFKGNDNGGAAINLSNTTPDTTFALTNVDIGNNTFDANNRAVLLFNVDDSTIHNNTMTGSTFANSGDIRIFGQGAAGGVDGLTITSNDMSGGAGWAIRITDGANTGIAIHLNNIANYAGDNTGPNPGGLFVSAGAYPGVLDATCNWWNDPCGPFNVANNPDGPGEEVREGVASNVNFISWLVAPGPAPAAGSGVCSGSPSTCEPIDHVQCYEIKPSAFAARNITAQDQFGTQTLTIRFPHRLCPPVDKNDEGILDPTEHLTGYKAKSTAKFTKRLDQVVVNQFGTLHLDVVRPDMFMVPTAKDNVPLAPPPGDHYTCYKVKRTRGAAKFVEKTVTVHDQLQDVTSTVLKPVRLCAPANKNGEDPTAPGHPDHLLCYKTKSLTKFGTIVKEIDNQFDTDRQVTLIHRREICVPSKKNPGATTTSTTAVPTTSTSSTTSSTSTTLIGSPSGVFLDCVQSLLD